jgi:hypothetical protein
MTLYISCSKQACQGELDKHVNAITVKRSDDLY